MDPVSEAGVPGAAGGSPSAEAGRVCSALPGRYVCVISLLFACILVAACAPGPSARHDTAARSPDGSASGGPGGVGAADRQSGRAAALAAGEATGAHEQPVVPILIEGDLASRPAEVSGLAWHGEDLICLPQYPERFPNGQDGTVFALTKASILAYLDGASQAPLVARKISFRAPGLSRLIPGYQGYEAIAFDGDRAYLTIEASRGDSMLSYLVAGEVSADGSALRVDTGNLVEITVLANVPNMSYEALVVLPDTVMALSEINGINLVANPTARIFAPDLHPLGTIPCPALEYRLTDATSVDADRRFWVMNFFFPGERDILSPAPDPLIARYGVGATHAHCEAVERLVAYRVSRDGVVLEPVAPIQLQLIDDQHSRNWEGLERLDERGFLLMTDKYPETILAFVPAP